METNSYSDDVATGISPMPAILQPASLDPDLLMDKEKEKLEKYKSVIDQINISTRNKIATLHSIDLELYDSTNSGDRRHLDSWITYVKGMQNLLNAYDRSPSPQEKVTALEA